MGLLSRHCAHVLATRVEMLEGIDVSGGMNPRGLGPQEMVHKKYCNAPVRWDSEISLYSCSGSVRHSMGTWRLSGAQKVALILTVMLFLILLKTFGDS